MLTNILTGPAGSPAAAGPLEHLAGCHSRIRHFTALALKLCHNAAPDQIASAAGAVRRYYEQGLPLHEADENDSLYPRLRRALPPGALADANQAMVDQHREIDALIATLVPQWAGLEQHPYPQAGLEAATQRLADLWSTHLQLEETIIFPALRQFLSVLDLAAIEGEMSARRALANPASGSV